MHVYGGDGVVGGFALAAAIDGLHARLWLCLMLPRISAHDLATESESLQVWRWTGREGHRCGMAECLAARWAGLDRVGRGAWVALRSLFSPDHDEYALRLGVARGHGPPVGASP